MTVLIESVLATGIYLKAYFESKYHRKQVIGWRLKCQGPCDCDDWGLNAIDATTPYKNNLDMFLETCLKF